MLKREGWELSVHVFFESNGGQMVIKFEKA